MKKVSMILATVAMLAMVSACGNNNQAAEATEEEAVEACDSTCCCDSCCACDSCAAAEEVVAE